MQTNPERMLVPADLTSKCPYCGAVVTVILGSYIDARRGGCEHVRQIERIETQIFVVFECKQKTPYPCCYI